MKRLWLSLLLTVVALAVAPAWASQSSSTNYQVNEVQFGPGGLLNATSTNYKAQQSLGSTGVAKFSSATEAANAGFLTPNVPFLELVVTPATLDLGTLSSSSAATGTGSFHVRAYVDSGYTVINASQTPANEYGYHLAAMGTAAASSPGTEQFGMNLVANTSPATFGANPALVPSSTFANGQAASGYNTANIFKFAQNDVIAQSGSNGWGETDYTISYIANINPISKAGHYSMVQDLVAVTTF